MKTLQRIIFLFAVLACAIQPTNAYEYFTIYFTDGTKSEPFFATDVDSIRYSKLDLDSIEYADWQVQEIWTVDSVYRYPLTSIASLDFKDVDENKVAEDIAKVNFAVNPLYLQSSSSEELAEQVMGLNSINGVEKVWTDNQSLFIQIKDYGIISYSYPPNATPSMAQNSRMSVHSGNKVIRHSLQSNEKLSHKHVEIKNVCVIRQMTQDLEFKKGIAESNSIVEMCKKWGLNVTINDNPLPAFFVNGIKSYDLVFLMTHGLYNGSHWLATSEEIYSQTLDKPLNEDSLCRVAKEFIKSKYYDKGYSPNDVNFSHLIENRNGVRTLVCYTWISNHFISKHNTPKSNNVVVFNAACQSMKGNNPELAEAFMKSGAVCYSGFTESNRIGPWTNTELCERLLSGFSVYSAYQSLPDCYYQETFELPENSGIMVNSKLILWPENELTSICITHPETLPAEMTSNNDGTIIKFKGSIKTSDPGKVLVEGGGYGFQYSEDPDFSTYQLIDNDMLDFVGHDKKTLEWSFETGNIESLLNRTTTCYYRAFMNDGYSECYGEIKSLEPYAVLNGETLTFYYDSKKAEREGTVYEIEDSYTSVPAWSNKFIKAVFDASFANYQPRSLYAWFSHCKSLKGIENIFYLNTSNVTNMGYMFRLCSSLTSLDLSSFNTSNVTNMASMFSSCYSLTSLNVSSFNTSNVTYMEYMFFGCSSLTSLNLSSFNTSNVTNMGSMFHDCFSLTDLNLSSFNTSMVTNMGSMFFRCRSLPSLDLNNFDTSKVTDMSGMFDQCSSLTTLDLSSFNTSKVTNMGSMFYDCSSLTNLNLSSFNTSKVTDMCGMFFNCGSLTMLDLGKFDTSNVMTMNCMFYNCASLKEIDVSRFKLSKVADASGMFMGCSSLSCIDLSSFEVSSSMETMCMFANCSSLNTIYAGNWLTTGIAMFSGCDSLTGEKGTHLWKNLYGYDAEGNPLYYYCPEDGKAAHIDGGKDNPGLFTAK